MVFDLKYKFEIFPEAGMKLKSVLVYVHFIFIRKIVRHSQFATLHNKAGFS